MFAWGVNSLGLYFNHEDKLTIPTYIQHFENDAIKAFAVADNRCCILLRDGSIHTFGNMGDRSLGHDSMTTKVSALETLSIVDIYAGGNQIFVRNDKGNIYGWGSNDRGQLGLKDDASVSAVVNVPKMLKFFDSRKVVQVTCGKYHSIVLLQDNTIFSMGDNSFGQLGFGHVSSLPEPMEVASLKGIPIAHVIAGGWHSFCITLSGKVFGWGKNDYGQLGLGDRANRKSPSLLKMLRSQAVMYIAAGENHTAVLTKDGGVFTFGYAASGQLGHGSTTECEVNPRKVFELMGSTVTQIACGNKHTLAYVPDSGNIFACGSGEDGQIGTGDVVDISSPTIVKGPWYLSRTTGINSQYPGASLYNIKLVGASGNQSFAIMGTEQEKPYDFRRILEYRKTLTLTNDFVDVITSSDGNITNDILLQLSCIFASPGCFNGSFLAQDHYETSTKYSGLNLMNARLLFSKLLQTKNKKIIMTLESSLSNKLLPGLSLNPPHLEALRIYISLLELPLLREPDCYNSLLFPFTHKLLSLAENPAKVLDQWYHKLEPTHFVMPVTVCQECIVFSLKQGLPPTEVKRKVSQMLEYLDKLNRINNQGKPVIAFQKFYIPQLAELIPLETDFYQWANSHGKDFSFCRYPFVLDTKAKTCLLQTDAKWQMQAAFENARGQNMAALLGLGNEYEAPIIELVVHRENLVQDTINKIASTGNLKRPLTVKFEGEEGQDAGGVRKEFFMLILKEILNPKYGMFRHYEDSALIWFSDYDLETDTMYFLVGTLCGLAIYNSMIIDLNFPLVLYKKLCGAQPNLGDLKELDPLLGRSLQQVLDYKDDEDNNVSDLCLMFTAHREVFGEVTEVELRPDGANITVTAENRQEYVEAYVNYVFNESVARPFEHFSEGFHRVCGGKVFNLFRPEELMEMVVGNQNYDWEELEKTAIYKGDYWQKHQVIIWFWQVFHNLSLDDKKDFLLFLTGCNKVPINGLKIVIQPMAVDESYLPVAHTCFNVLDLPRYSSKEKLEAKLKLALKCNKGFYIV